MKNQRWLIAALLIVSVVSQFAMHPLLAAPTTAAEQPVAVTWPTITFDDPAITYTLTDFGGTSSSVVLDPAGGANNVAKIIKTLAAQLWAGTTISTGPNFSVPPIPFSATDTIMTMRVWAPAAGIPIRLKVEDASDPTKSCETEAVTTVANAWQTLTFNFANPAPGTAALNLAYTYNKVSVFPYFGSTGAQIGADTTYYFDDLAFAGSTPTTPTPTPTPPPASWPTITFDDPAITYTLTDFGGTSSSVVLDPAGGANNVAKIIKTFAAELWAGTTISTGPNFSVPPIPFSATDTTMTMRVWAPAAGIPIRLKVEDASDPTKSCETEAVTTVANAWQTLTFNFANPAPGTAALNLAYTYNKVSVFPYFGSTGAQIGADTTYYFDDLAFAGSTPTTPTPTPTPTPPPASWPPITFDDPAITYTLTDFGGTSSSVVLDPAGGANNVAKIIKTFAAELWAGTTISTGPNFSVPPIPFSATDTTMTMRVWAPAAGIPIRLKVEDASYPTKSCETETTTTAANAWQTLTFNFANPAPGTAALNLAYTYNKVSVFPYFGSTGAQIGADTTYYFDDLTFGSSNVPPVGGNSVIVDDFEDGLLPSGTDPNGIGVGFITWNHPAASAAISIIDNPPAQVPGADAGNKVLREALTIGGGQWAGYTHAFTNAAANQWLSQDWSTYEGVSLWLYGNNTGGSLFLDILDNRNPGSTTDDAERWSVDIPDNFTGWRSFQFAWGDFHRKDIGNGAPNDGFGRTEIHGYGIGGYGSVPMGSQVYYVDDVTIYGNTGGGPAPLQAQFALTHYTVTEGGLATISLSLSTAPTQTVTVGYRTAEAYARPNRNYVPTSGSVTFAPNETEKAFTVQTLADGKPSGDQQVMLNLTSVTNAAFGYRRRALLTITDTNAANPAMVDDFEGHHPFQAEGRVRLTIRDIPAGSPLAVPGQGPYEQVLKISVPGPAEASSTASITRTFAAGQNWSGYGNLAFWFYGANSGVPVTVKLLDNQAPTLPPPSQWVMAWSDEFNDAAGSPPDANAWGYELGDGTMNAIPGWGNSEEEFYSDSPDSVAMDGNGNLRLRLQALDPATTDKVCWYGPCKYTSARLLTKNRTEFRYGRIEARVKVPSGESGLWPAFWSLGTNIDQVGWPQAGEIDIMEYVSRIPTEIFGTIHGPGYSGGNAYGNIYDFGSPVAATYHTYAVEWAPNEIHWYVDGINYHNATPANVAPNEWVYNHPFYLLLNLAIGGNFGGSISPNLTFPQDMLVDYVRVYQAADTAERFEATFVDNIPGWRQIVIPFSAFTRSAVQPAGAPNDGLTLTNMTGYGFDLQVGQNAAPDSRTFHLDQVHLTITAPTAVTIAETSRTQPAPWLPLAAMTILALLVAAFVVRRRLA